MNVVNFDQIKREISRYLDQIQNGDSLLIVKDGQPVAELKPFSFGFNSLTTSGEKRPFGLCAGEFSVPKDFDEPLPNSILNDFDCQ
jgi:antitoxin (DNA-binding transcriptional repressor) of toxin-antitoxin stability system